MLFRSEPRVSEPIPLMIHRLSFTPRIPPTLFHPKSPFPLDPTLVTSSSSPSMSHPQHISSCPSASSVLPASSPASVAPHAAFPMKSFTLPSTPVSATALVQASGDVMECLNHPSSLTHPFIHSSSSTHN